MSSGKRTFQGISWKCLLPGALALFFYGGAVLAFGSMMEEPSVSVFLSGAYPEEKPGRGDSGNTGTDRSRILSLFLLGRRHDHTDRAGLWTECAGDGSRNPGGWKSL